MLRSSLFAAALALTVASPALHASGPDDEALRRQMFGSSIALLGDEAFVGEPTGANMVHIYRRTGGSWARSGELKVEGLDGSARFGQSLSADGNTLLVGYLNLADSARGGVHIFTRGSDGRWSDSGPLMASPPARSGFGSAVIVSGDWAFVGAPNSQPGGAVYVFRRSGSAWTAAGMIPSDGVMAGDRFGASLSLDGKTHCDEGGERRPAIAGTRRAHRACRRQRFRPGHQGGQSDLHCRGTRRPCRRSSRPV